MYASTYPSDLAKRSQSLHQRVNASATASFKHGGTKTRLDRLHQHASAKIRFPKVHSGPVEAVLINTAGGLTGGDVIDWNLVLGKCSEVVATTQACEKLYKSTGDYASVRNTIKLEANACLHWLPQETIVYDGSRLDRQFDVALSEGSRFLAVESFVLGREAMGETSAAFHIKDRWRIKYNDRLVFADHFELTDPFNSIAQFGEHLATSTLVYVSDLPQETLEALASDLNQLCAGSPSCFSAFDGKITARILAKNSYELRKQLAPLLKRIRGCDLPRVWRI